MRKRIKLKPEVAVLQVSQLPLLMMMIAFITTSGGLVPLIEGLSAQI